MINPQPVNEPRSPYSSDANPTPSIRPPLPSSEIPIVEPKPKKRAWKRWVPLSAITIVFAIGGFAAATYQNFKTSVIATHEGATSKVLKSNLNNSSSVNASDFTKPGDGRFNIVIVGIGGANHPGGMLTDTIQVLSIDTINKKSSATSIPRDLYYNIPGYGHAKINSVYSLAEAKKAGSGMQAVRDAVGNVLGITVTNFALMDFSAIKDVVDEIGGIDVDVPKAISDPFFPADDTVHYKPFYISAGLHHMDGNTALTYSRSRETTSDFDRSARQQIVMQAIKKKTLSTGTLANPLKVLSLINTLGSHFKTDMQTDDIQTFISLYQNIPADGVSNFVLDTTSTLGLLTDSSDTVAGYINYPLLGYDKYDAIHQWWQKNNPDPILAREAPTVTVVNNGKATVKQMDAMSQKLKDYGYIVTVSTTPASTSTTSTQIIARENGKKQVSQNYLTNILSVSSTTVDATLSTDFEVIVTPSSIASTTITPRAVVATPKASSTPASTPTPTAIPTPDPTPTPTPDPTPSDSPTPTP